MERALTKITPAQVRLALRTVAGLLVIRMYRRRGALAALVATPVLGALLHVLETALRYSFGSFGMLGYNPFEVHVELHKRVAHGKGFLRQRIPFFGDMAMAQGQPAIEHILRSHRPEFLREPGWPRTFKNLIGYSLFTREDGPEAARIRRTVVSSLHGTAMRDYLQVMDAKAHEHLDRLVSQTKRSPATLHDEMKRYTFDVSTALLLGRGFADGAGADVEKLGDWFKDLTAGFTSIPIDLGEHSTYGRALRARNNLHKHLEQLISLRKTQIEQARQNGTPLPKDAFTNLITTVDEETGQSLSIDELKTQSILNLIAGHDSTSSILTAFLVVLSQNDRVRSKLRAEQDALFAARGGANGELTMDDLQGGMPYLDATLCE